MIEKLKNEKNIKIQEIREIEDKIQAAEYEIFKYLIGKYLKLSATCVFRVDSIVDFDNREVYVNGLQVFSSEIEFRIELNGSESINRNIEPSIITKEQFLEFFNKNSDAFKNAINKTLSDLD